MNKANEHFFFRRSAWLALPMAVALLAIAPHAVAQCGPWTSEPARFGLGADFLVGVGAATGSGPAAAGAARQQALAEMAAQIRVHVSSQLTAEARAVSQGGFTSESQRVESTTRTATSLDLEGAEVKATCEERGQTVVLVALDRRLYASGARQRINAKRAQLGALETKAQQAAADRRRIDAVSALVQAARLAESLEDEATILRVVARTDAEAGGTPSATLWRRAKEESSRTVVLVRSEPPRGTEALRKAAVSCLTTAGLGASEAAASPDAILTLTVTLDPPVSGVPGLFVTTGQLAASLRAGGSEPVIAASTERVKGGGGSTHAASQDAIRKLGGDRLARAVDDLLKAQGWQLRPCASRR